MHTLRLGGRNLALRSRPTNRTGHRVVVEVHSTLTVLRIYGFHCRIPCHAKERKVIIADVVRSDLDLHEELKIAEQACSDAVRGFTS